MHAAQQTAVFEYLDLLSMLWEQSISDKRLQVLEQQMPVVLTKLRRCCQLGRVT